MPKEALFRGQFPWYSQMNRVPPLAGEHRGIKVLTMREALSRWSQTHIWLYFRRKKHLHFEIQVTKAILSEH